MSKEKVENEEVEKNEDAQAENTEPSFEDKYLEANDKFLRLYAEFENFRRRTNKEKLDLISTANAGVVTDLLPIVDDFDRAIENNKTSEDIDGIKEGFTLIANKVNSILTSKGLKEMEVVNEKFDPELHEAIANIPAPTKKQKGKVIEAVEKGYYLNEKVIRYAKVVVGQ
jgi:molecular chaperone GrpE